MNKLDSQIKILEKRIEHYNLLLKTSRQKALAKGQAGDKAGALHDLTRAKQIEKDLATYHGMMEKLLTQRHAVEQASFQVETLKVMEVATSHLDATTRQMPVEKAEEIMEATEEAKQNLEDIQQILVGPPRDTSEEEAELAAMLAPAPGPAVPAVVAPVAAQPATPSELEQDLARLAALETVSPEPAQTRVAIPL